MPATTASTVRPLTEIIGTYVSDGFHYTVECRDGCDITELTVPQTAYQAGLQQRRHLAEHLEALAAEITEAAR